MTDEPTSESSPEGPLPPPAAETPTAADTPTAAETPPAAETPTTPVASVPVEEPTEAAPVTPTTTSTTDAPRRKGVLVPVWALVTVAGLLLIVASGLVGYAIGSHDDGNGRTARAGGFQLPGRQLPPGFGQFGNGSNGNGEQRQRERQRERQRQRRVDDRQRCVPRRGRAGLREPAWGRARARRRRQPGRGRGVEDR